MKQRLYHMLLLVLCMMMALTSAGAQGLSFSLSASVAPAVYPDDKQSLMQGLASLLNASRVDGQLILNDSSFDMNAALYLGSGRDRSSTTLRVWGTDSHWGVQSSLLGDTELMVSCASLLPFGQKVRNHLGLPLDATALLIPYTHADALSAPAAVLAPLFPTDVGKTSLTRAELDAMLAELLRLSEEDPAFNRWLEVTGLYRTFRRYCRGFASVSEIILPGVTVKRTENSLTWSANFVPLLSIRQDEHSLTASFSVPTLINLQASIITDGRQLEGEFLAELDGFQAEASFLLPATPTASLPDIRLKASCTSADLPDGGVSLTMTGECDNGAITLHMLDEASKRPLFTLTALVDSFSPDTLPVYTAEELTGVNLLSITSDSLQMLLREIWKPLLSGSFDLLVAAPPEAVQTLMDALEEMGIIDLLRDSLSGGSGY